MATKLTGKQQLFIKEYLIDLNATQAAIRAGYSAKTSFAIGIENLRKPIIAEAIKKAMDARSEKTDINAEWVLKSFKKVADRSLTDEKYDGANALRALEDIGKHFGMFVERKALTDENGKDIIVPLFMLALDKAYGSH